MLKATSIDRRGCQSYPVSLEVNAHGYVELPEDPDAVQYALYAPFFDESQTGPWYLVRCISRREARAARYTVVGLYKQSVLLPQLCPPDSLLTLPEAAEDQGGWFVFGGSEPIGPASMWIELPR